MEQAFQCALILSLMIAYRATEKSCGFDVESANLFRVLNEGSKDGVNEVAGSMPTKLSCFLITGDRTTMYLVFNPKQDVDDDFLLSVFCV